MRMFRFGLGFVGLAAGLLAGGCKSTTETSPPPLTSATCSDPTAAVVITDPTNYSLTDDFTMQVATLKDNTDLVFDWSRVTVDFFGKAVDPANDIDTVLLSLWNLTPAGIEEALKVDNLPLAQNNGVITTFPDGTYTSQDLLNFNLLGQPLPVDQLWGYFNTATPNYQYPQDQYTFLAMAQTGTDVGRNPRMISLFHIDPTATQTELDFTNSSTKLDYSVDLIRAAPLRVPAGTPALTIDWGQMHTNAIGNEYVYSQITQAAVAHYTTKDAPRAPEGLPQPGGDRGQLVVGRGGGREQHRSERPHRQGWRGIPGHRLERRLDGGALLHQLQQPGPLVDHHPATLPVDRRSPERAGFEREPGRPGGRKGAEAAELAQRVGLWRLRQIDQVRHLTEDFGRGDVAGRCSRAGRTSSISSAFCR